MFHLFFSVLCSVLFLLPNISEAACSNEMTGSSASYYVDISDNGCGYNYVMIKAWKFSEDAGMNENPDQLIQFSEECKFFDESAGEYKGFECKKNGKTILAGSVYKPTKDTNTVCPGERLGIRLTCQKNCPKHAPQYLYIRPYEC